MLESVIPKNIKDCYNCFLLFGSQAYTYLEVCEKEVLEGIISIDKIKEMGFNGIYYAIQKTRIVGNKSRKYE
ncbi:plasmid partition family protein (plasmid) [Borreliella andersonii]|uniref:Plasmid partition family protein n=1 Tax=Borrelia andersonii TaxID=42109 RepID=A0ACD5G6B0_BORAD